MRPLQAQTVSILLLGLVLCLWNPLEPAILVHAFGTGPQSFKRPCLSGKRVSQTQLISPRVVRHYNLAASTTDSNVPSRENDTPSPHTPTPTHATSSRTTDTVWSKRQLLFRMTRPTSIPGVVLFHMVGTYLALQTIGYTHNYWNVLLKSPKLWLTFVCELLVSSTSMIINDYYDAKLKRDAHKQVNLDKKVLVSGKVSFPLAKRFVTYLYSLALLLVCFLPGAPTRLAVTMGLMVTYLYTKHLKPVLLVKNIVCASLVALTPWTSASAAIYTVAPTTTSVHVVTIPSLARLFAALFFGVMGREVMLDCNDVKSDKHAGIQTIPVTCGCGYSSRVALCTTICMSIIAVSQPIWQLWKTTAQMSLWNVLQSSPVTCRRLGLALTASIIMLRRSWQVYQTRGKDSRINSTAVDESLMTVVFLLASFI